MRLLNKRLDGSVIFSNNSRKGQILTGFVADEERIHPTQKPVKLYRWVLEMEDEPYFDDDDAVTDAVKE